MKLASTGPFFIISFLIASSSLAISYALEPIYDSLFILCVFNYLAFFIDNTIKFIMTKGFFITRLARFFAGWCSSFVIKAKV